MIAIGAIGMQAERRKKTGASYDAPAFIFSMSLLLNRDLALHAEGLVRSAMIWVLAGLDVRERNRD
jgi:hypothetical protein